MRIACATIAYREERFIPKFIQAMQDRVSEILVLNSEKPLFGPIEEGVDKTPAIARSLGATVITFPWETEPDMRNTGNEYLMDYDWIIWLDPDEYLVESEWQKLLKVLEKGEADAYTNETMNLYWKNGYIIDPPENHTPIIATRPYVRFFDTRCITSPFAKAPVCIDHFSWARTNQEIKRKVTHYGEADKFDGLKWYEEVFTKWEPGMQNLHPVNPPALKEAIPVIIPEELERLDLWPSN
jgi:hypothetical protein